VAITPDGRRALSSSKDKTLKLWDLDSGQELRTFSGHSDSVNAVAITPDGRRALSGSWDNTLKLWDLDSGQELRTFSGHSHSVNAIAITPDGRHSLSGSIDKTLRLWDLDSGRGLRTFSGYFSTVHAVAITPDGRRALSGSYDKTLKLWDISEGMPPVVAPVAPPQPLIAPAVVEKPTPQLPTQPRYALLIGNQNYPKFQPSVNHARPLKNPRADAQDLGELLKSYGFNVTVVTDADRETMKAAVSKFTQQLPPKSSAFFFYAGHGIQLYDKTEGESNNYLLPVAENFATPAQIKHYGVSAQWIRDEFQGSRAQFKFMILDACREKMVIEGDARGGLVSRGGFGAMGASGIMIAYAAARNQLAYDNESARNGIYTGKLLEAMRQGKHWTIEKVLKTTNTAVVDMTKDTETPQEPWIEGNLTGDDFCLAGCQ
jgi:Caspase domain/WD domain, G-beta repeat